MCHYKHLTLEEREKILYFSAKEYSVTDIAKELGRNKSTISRELKRNREGSQYLPSKAQQKYAKRRKTCKPHKRLDNPELFQLVREKFLEHQWSPEQIAGRLALEHHKTIVSYATIYRAIYSGMLDTGRRPRGNKGVIRKLRHRGKLRHSKQHEERRGKIKISHEISQRPAGAANRSRRGHWEGDTVAGVKGKACLVTLVDRKSRYLLGGKADAQKADAVNAVMIQALRNEPLRSITPDRGKEFAKHAEVTAALDQVKFYFPLPHHPWERGTNENTNGLLREYFPKWKDLSDIPDSYIQEKFDELNKRPRKCLGYRTPFEVYHSKVLHLA